MCEVSSRPACLSKTTDVVARGQGIATLLHSEGGQCMCEVLVHLVHHYLTLSKEDYYV